MGELLLFWILRGRNRRRSPLVPQAVHYLPHRVCDCRCGLLRLAVDGGDQRKGGPKHRRARCHCHELVVVGTRSVMEWNGIGNDRIGWGRRGGMVRWFVVPRPGIAIRNGERTTFQK